MLVLIGDTGQLPAVLGRVMWELNNSTATAEDIAGRALYHQFTTVANLTVNVRIIAGDDDAQFFDEFLVRLRDGKVTINDYQRIRTTCSRYTLRDREWEQWGFLENDVTHLFSTNREVDVENRRRLALLQKPIAKVVATNS